MDMLADGDILEANSRAATDIHELQEDIPIEEDFPIEEDIPAEDHIPAERRILFDRSFFC